MRHSLILATLGGLFRLLFADSHPEEMYECRDMRVGSLVVGPSLELIGFSAIITNALPYSSAMRGVHVACLHFIRIENRIERVHLLHHFLVIPIGLAQLIC